MRVSCPATVQLAALELCQTKPTSRFCRFSLRRFKGLIYEDAQACVAFGKYNTLGMLVLMKLFHDNAGH